MNILLCTRTGTILKVEYTKVSTRDSRPWGVDIDFSIKIHKIDILRINKKWEYSTRKSILGEHLNPRNLMKLEEKILSIN